LVIDPARGADEVLHGDVKERESEAVQRRRHVERGQRRHEVRQHERDRAAGGAEREQSARAVAVGQRADRPRQQQRKQEQQAADQAHGVGRRAEFEREQGQHDPGGVRSDEIEIAQDKGEMDHRLPQARVGSGNEAFWMTFAARIIPAMSSTTGQRRQLANALHPPGRGAMVRGERRSRQRDAPRF